MAKIGVALKSSVKPLRYLKFWYSCGIFWVLCVVYLSTTPSPPDTSGVEFGDKIVHTLGYFCLFYWFGQIYQKSSFWQPAIALIFLGVALEFVQNHLGYRTLEVADMLANTSGVLLGWMVARFIYDHIFVHVEAILNRRH